MELCNLNDGMAWYLTPSAPFLTVHVGGKSYRAVDGILKLTPDVAMEFERLRQERPDIYALAHKPDFQTGEQLVKAHQEAFRASQLPQAVRGTFTSDNGEISRARAASIEQRPEIMTGRANITLGTNPKDNKPLEMTEVKVASLKSGTPIDRLRNH